MAETEVPSARILAALDPTGPCEEAEQLALLLARSVGAELVLATVYPLIRLRSYAHSRRYETLLRQEAEGYLAGRVDALRERAPDLVITTDATGSASAAHGLHRLAREMHASLVVVGPSRRRGVGRTVPGTMGARFAHGAPCPVAVAAAGAPSDRLARVGVAFVPTGDGELALHAAALLAERAGATLEVIAVAAPVPWMGLVEPDFDGARLQELYEGHVAYALKAAVAALPATLRFETAVCSGDPVDALAGRSARLDLLVCGSRAHGPLGEVALGSVSHAVVDAARCPVLLVPRITSRVPGAECPILGAA